MCPYPLNILSEICVCPLYQEMDPDISIRCVCGGGVSKQSVLRKKKPGRKSKRQLQNMEKRQMTMTRLEIFCFISLYLSS